MDNDRYSSQSTSDSDRSARPAGSLGVRLDDCRPRCAVRYGSGVRYDDSTRTTGTHAAASLMLSLCAFLIMLMTPLLTWLVVPCLIAIAASLYYSFKAIRSPRPARGFAPRVIAYGGLMLSVSQLSLLVILSFAVAYLDYTLPY